DAAGEHRQRVAAQHVPDLGVRPRSGAEAVVPAQPVGGARHDPQQGALWHARLDRLEQLLRGLRRSGAAALLQPGHPVVDEQVGVVLITRLQLHGGVQVPVLEVGDEPFGGLRQADLGAERGQVLLALLPRQQVLGPVGVLVGADDGDVAGAQLLGQEQNTIASKWRRSTIPGRRRSHTTRRQLPEAKPIPDSGSSSSTGGGSGMKSRRLPAYSRACSNAASTESSEEVAFSSKWPTRSNITARSFLKNRCTSTS